jgi:hypothetical protein
MPPTRRALARIGRWSAYVASGQALPPGAQPWSLGANGFAATVAARVWAIQSEASKNCR